jgi:hypothetical protein
MSSGETIRSSALAAFMTAALSVAGCYGSVGYSAPVGNDGYGPELVYAAPGVQVIADYDDSIFFADSFYWRFDGGGWYRSPRYNGGWVYATPPLTIQRIDRPRAFVHYRPQGWVSRQGRGPQQAMQRDGRDDRPRFQGRPAPQARMAQPAPPFRGPERGVQQPPRGPQQPPRPTQQPPRADQQPFRGGQPPSGDREHGPGRDHDERR